MTKQIELTQGLFALVDNKLYDWLNQWKWHAYARGHTYYVARNQYNNKTRTHVSMHRLISGLSRNDGKEVDHVNRNGLDNRKSNLRVVSHLINMRNHGTHIVNKSGHNGVYKNPKSGKWCACISVYSRNIHLGSYRLIEDAIEARRQGELKHWN